MDSQNAIKLLDDTFNNGYAESRFLNFIRELFNGFDANPKKHLVPNTFNEYIDPDNYRHLGEYRDSSGKLIDVLAIKLRKGTSRDRARTMQRNFVAKHLSENNKHAALVAFYDYDPEDWRFSFVKLDYRLERDDSGKVKPVEELTPAKRYSFLVGVNEPNHTCRSQFLGLIKEENINPSFDEIEDAFSIEKVTKVFFEKYKELYLELKEALDTLIENDSRIKDDFVEKEISAVDFAKKLLGQIVFLYFLQKKGWLGIERDENSGKFKEWGSGHKKFLTRLVHGKIIDYENMIGNHVNFFNDILEPLFYQAFATERDDDYYEIYDYKCKIPFLNGGLFEPINNYNWKETDILLDNSIFKTIVDRFDEFNFTVKEDEPLEKEVAVDPEMLGKVFENLLDVKDRRSRGAFYTPREIVHYMCQQSLINYLETNTKDKNIPLEDLETFIQFGDYSSSADQRYLIEINKLLQDIISRRSKNVVRSQEKIQKLISKLTLPNSIISNKELIDRLLTDIKVVDPAVGSGAFPVGMMNEIVKARSILTIFWLDDAVSDERTAYTIKRQTIQNCLYGVDIDSSAVDITKLRFWLSLIVDEDDMEHIQPLPNLDNKIMCGNSLLEEFEGVKLFDEKMLGELVIDHSFEIEQIDSKIEVLNEKLHRIYTRKNTDDGDQKQIKKQISKLENKKKKLQSTPKEKTQQLNLSDAENFRIKQSQHKLRELRALQKQFFDAKTKNEKDKLRNKIDNLEWELIEETLKEDGNEESIQKLNQYKKAKSKPFFLWKLYFAEVFQRENPGFDVVIANPPYVGHKGGQKALFQELKRTGFGGRFNNERMDIFYYFFHLGLDIGRVGCEVAFITTNYYITADSAVKLRSDFKLRTNIRKLVNFNEFKIFDSARGQHNMLTFLTKNQTDKILCDVYSTNKMGVATSDILSDILEKNDTDTNYYCLSQAELYEGDMNYIRLFYGKLKNRKSIDSILDKLRDQSISLKFPCGLSQGIVSGIDKISKKHIKKIPSLSNSEGEGVFVINHTTRKMIGSSPLLRPWFKNSDISKYKVNESNSLWIIHTHTELDMGKYPNIKNHLLKYESAIKSRNYESGELSKAKKLGKWWALSSSRREFDFSKPKIVSPQRSYHNTFAYTEKEWVASADVYFISINDKNYNLKYILSLLNSKLYYLWLYFRGKRKGEMLELYLTPLSEIPIKKISPSQQNPFINLVDQILAITKDPDYLENPSKQAQVKTLENQIDQLVYKLYDLTPEEIEIVEGFNEGK